MCNLLNYSVLGNATVFLSNDHSLYVPIYLGWTLCLITFAFDQTTCQERVGSEKYKMKNSCPQWDSKSQPWNFKSGALPTELAWFVECCPFKWPHYIHVLPIPMYTLYGIDKVERNLSCKCTVSCNILESIYIVQITKRRISPALHFNMQIPD